jgi:asparagine synthase (glutamine-hydrolysing)
VLKQVVGMSGIVGIISLDGSPVDKVLLNRMTAFMDFRGPDARQVWINGDVGFGHTMLRTTFEAESERQPISLDETVWITADARIDGRSDLINKLRGKGRRILPNVTDPELILHAYLVWEDNCVDHLIGDFSYAIWDDRKKRLFCARDHFGVKPFYYARVNGQFIFSNTLNCLRQHPGVSSALNDLAIADFLMFGSIQDLDATSFNDIRRLSGAHKMILKGSGLHTRRYWSLPVDSSIRYKNDQDYIDHFKEILTTSICDRLHIESVACWMSGGLDSTAIAAIIRNLPRGDSKPKDIFAQTIVYDHLIADPERKFSRMVSQSLDIHHDYLTADEYLLFDQMDNPDLTSPEPVDQPFVSLSNDFLSRTATRSRVALDGQGADEILYRECIVNLIGRAPFNDLLIDLGNTLFRHHLRPAFCIRSQINQWLGRSTINSAMFPPWINKNLSQALNLEDRYLYYSARHMESDVKRRSPSMRPSAVRRLNSNHWSEYLESYDPGITGLPLEVRWPFLDKRLVDDLLAFPPIPWFIDKAILRQAMKDNLPEAVRLRPKTPMLGDAVAKNLTKESYRWIDDFIPTTKLQDYVIRDKIPKLVEQQKYAVDPHLNLRPLALNFWLRNYTLIGS